VKLYSFLSVTEFHDAIATAKKLNMYTAGHIPFAVGLNGILSEGMNEIAHIEELDFEFVDFDRSRTLGHEEWFRYILQIATEKMGRFADLPLDELKLNYQTKIKKIIHKLNQLLLRELHDGDVTLVLGTDAGGIGMGLVPGFSLHDELRIMIENGFSPYEAIRTATVNAAEVINKTLL